LNVPEEIEGSQGHRWFIRYCGRDLNNVKAIVRHRRLSGVPEEIKRRLRP
jgi:hypothetical protein